jgi:hypothetical protein
VEQVIEEPKSTRSEISLASLSLLITFDKEYKQDYLDYLTPFIIDIFRANDLQGITKQVIQEAFKTSFGLYLPIQPIELALKRLTNNRVLRASPLYGGIYSPGSRYPKTPRRLDEEKSACLVSIRGVMVALMAFAADSFKVTWSPEQATDAVTGYLANYAIDCLKACFDRSTIAFVDHVKESDFVVNAFVKAVLETGGELSEQVVTLVKAQMLANSLLCPDIGRESQDFSRVTLFLDTPLVLRLLDLDTDAAHCAAQETLELCRKLGSRIAVFSHTATETYGVIKGSAIHMDDPKFIGGRLIREMHNRGTTAEELLLIADGLEACLANLGVEVIDTPAHDPKYEISEIHLDSALEEEIKYLHARARQFDIDSIRAIYTIRSGKAPRTLESCKAVLVTTNSRLARIAFQFGQSFEDSREVSTVVSSFSLANLAWLKGGYLSSTLPKAEMLSLAYAALQPSNAFWERFFEVEARMREQGFGTPAQHAVLRYSPQAQKHLMNLTLGDEDKITAKTVQELVERAESEIVKHEREVIAAERSLHKDELSSRDLDLAHVRMEKEQLLAGLEKIVDERRAAKGEIARLASSLAKAITWICLLPSALVVAIAWEVDKVIPSTWAIKHPATIISSLFLLILAIWGVSPVGWSRRIGTKFEQWLVAYVNKRYFPPVELTQGQKLLEARTESAEPS